ncbi:vWA domain-containing protein [Glaciecola sp. MF2-115]|uniref:vWA domain-containing protein n=1 Tax=Glaciecola sp. MF2-115 TaxID=3384827 RepID=UPI00399F7D00
MFEFAWIWVLAILPLPLLVYFTLPRKATSESAALLVPNYLKVRSDGKQSQKKSSSRLFLASLIWCCLVVAAARPQWLGEPVSIPNEGRDLMIAVDLSGSMKQGDMRINGREVNRLVMTKYVLRDFIERRVGDRLGLILFADTAYLQAPLTFDRETVKTLLDESVLGLVGERTAIGDAIGLAVKRFDDKEESNRVLILLTDGRNTAGNITPEQANELAIDKGITIYTIGLGAEEQEVASVFGRRTINPSQDLDEGLLQDIAKSTGGQYFRARDTQELESIYETLDRLEPIEGEGQKLRPLTALFYLPLGVALLISALYSLFFLCKHVLIKWQTRNSSNGSNTAMQTGGQK